MGVKKNKTIDHSDALELIAYGLAKFAGDKPRKNEFANALDKNRVSFLERLDKLGIASSKSAASARQDNYDPFFENTKKGYVRPDIVNRYKKIIARIDAVVGSLNMSEYVEFVQNLIEYECGNPVSEEYIELIEAAKKAVFDKSQDVQLIVQDLNKDKNVGNEVECNSDTNTEKEVGSVVFQNELQSKKIEVKYSARAVIDYQAEHKKKEEIGRLGEEYIFEREIQKVNSFNLSSSKRVIWTSKEKGDGLGYDILSYDENGEEIYIEVKTTEGGRDTEFYVTSTELKKSIDDSKQFYLYRVYEFDRETKIGKIDIYPGSLKVACQNPILYKVAPDNKKSN